MKSVKLITAIALSTMIMSFNVPSQIKSHGTEIKNYEGSALVWKTEEVDLGKIPQGKPVAVKFEFTNKGKEAIIISNVATSCGWMFSTSSLITVSKITGSLVILK